MFRRFFPGKDKGQDTNPQNSQQSEATRPPDPAEAEQAKKTLAQFLPHPEVDDGVHRMAMRAGNEPLPDDPDEQAYGHEQGEHAELAQDALQKGDLQRSIYHLALALAEDPEREEWLSLLEQWIAAAGPQAIEMVPLYDKAYFATLQASQKMLEINATNSPDHRIEVIPVVNKHYHAKVAVHAFILITQGKTQEGTSLLLQLITVKPEIPYIAWFARWQDQPGFADALDPKKVLAACLPAIQKYPGTTINSEKIRKELRRYLPALRICYLSLKQKPANELFLTVGFLYTSVLRKIGELEEAITVTRTLPASYQTRVSLAMALDAQGDLEGSIAAYREALSFNPDDVAVRNDMGNLYLTHGKFPEALAMYEESASLDPADPYQQAHASIAYLRFLQAPALEKLQPLQKLAESQQSARHLLSRLDVYYENRLPEPHEALISTIRQIQDGLNIGEIDRKRINSREVKVRTRVTSLEAPSARLAALRTVDSWGATFELTIDAVYAPDPRLPLRPVEYQVWRYEELEPIPAVAPPDPSVAQQITELARTPYALLAWYDQAQTLGLRLGEAALTDLLALMVHPPTTPDGWNEWHWIIAIQLASALTIASLQDQSAWDGSRRKAALHSLVYGPTDWSGMAALIALAVLARQNKQIAGEFDALCCDLWNFGHGTSGWPLERAMVFGLLFIGTYSAEASEHIRRYYNQIHTR